MLWTFTIVSLPQARFEEAEQVARQALEMVSDGRNALQYAGAQARLARILCYRGELREAEEKTRAALSILQRRYEADKDKTVEVKIEGKTVQYPIGMLRDRYHLCLIDAVSARAYLLICLRKYNEALPLLELEGTLRMAAAANSVAAGKIGELHAKLGDFEQAAKLIKQNIDYSKTVSQDSPVFSYAPLRRMAVLLLKQGQLDAAEDYFNQSLMQYLRLTQGNQVDRWEMLSGLAEVKLRQGKLEEARKLCEETEPFAKLHSPKFPELLDYYRVYAETLTQLGRPGDAKRWQDLADEIERRIADAIRS